MRKDRTHQGVILPQFSSYTSNETCGVGVGVGVGSEARRSERCSRLEGMRVAYYRAEVLEKLNAGNEESNVVPPGVVRV